MAMGCYGSIPSIPTLLNPKLAVKWFIPNIAIYGGKSSMFWCQTPQSQLPLGPQPADRPRTQGLSHSCFHPHLRRRPTEQWEVLLGVAKGVYGWETVGNVRNVRCKSVTSLVTFSMSTQETLGGTVLTLKPIGIGSSNRRDSCRGLIKVTESAFRL